jgi:hypothetical protein
MGRKRNDERISPVSMLSPASAGETHEEEEKWIEKA